MKSCEIKIDKHPVIPKCWIARSFVSRFLGVMGRKRLPRDEAFYFPKCNSIHTFFVRFPIDVVFLESNGVVVRVIQALRPWRLVLPVPKAVHVLELAAQRAGELGIAEGVKLESEVLWQ